MTTFVTPAPDDTAPAAPHDARESLARLESQIQELSRHLTAGTARLLELVAEFDRRHGWAEHGQRSCAAWLSSTCGFGPAAARERVRVARAVETLPVIRGAFSRGELSYSKVRALTRIASPETEAELAAAATELTAAQVERMSRRRKAADNGQKDDRKGLLTWRQEADGLILLEARLTPAQFDSFLIGMAEAHDAMLAGVEQPAEPVGESTDPAEIHAGPEQAPAAGTEDQAEGADLSVISSSGAEGADLVGTGAEEEAPPPHPDKLVWVSGGRTGRASVDIFIRMLRAPAYPAEPPPSPEARPPTVAPGDADVAA